MISWDLFRLRRRLFATDQTSTCRSSADRLSMLEGWNNKIKVVCKLKQFHSHPCMDASRMHSRSSLLVRFQSPGSHSNLFQEMVMWYHWRWCSVHDLWRNCWANWRTQSSRSSIEYFSIKVACLTVSNALLKSSTMTTTNLDWWSTVL